jgi:hypothetical protein
MDEGATFEGFIRGGLGMFGIEPDDVDMAVIAAADGVWGAATRTLMTADLSKVPPEPNPDLSAPPAP